MLAPERHPLVLAPSSEDGWFGGRAFAAADPIDLRAGVSLDEAAAALEEAYTAEQPMAVAVLAAYDGTCTVARYAGFAIREQGEWQLRGNVAPDIALPDPSAGAAGSHTSPLLSDFAWDTSAREYRTAVEDVRERIAAGSVYVLNLTARATGALVPAGPADAFAELQRRAASPMSAFLHGWPGATPWLASVSPERFVRVRVGEDDARLVEVCPIKGTRQRGATPEADAEYAAELACDEKERAEHVMVVDLERNDLGVTCVPGTVRVDPLYHIVPTPYCYQLVSTVHGTMRHDATFSQLLSAAFPCGSVTGAPKVAAMQIIAEAERSPRGAYCGALLVAIPGEMDSSVLIRTLEGIAEKPEAARWGAGCGVTYESDAAAEYLELLLKASPVMGDGVPEVALRETMRVVRGSVPLLDRHLTRLAEGGAGPSTLARVRDVVHAELVRDKAAGDYARLGVTVTPDGEVAAGLTAEPSSLDVPGGVRYACIEVDRVPDLPTAAAKPAGRGFWDRAHRAARMQGADQAVLMSPSGELIDGSTATLWLVIDGELLTPPAAPAVAGVLRGLVFDLAWRHGVRAREARLTRADLDSADEVFFTNAVGLVSAARGRAGAVHAAVKALVRDAVR